MLGKQLEILHGLNPDHVPFQKLLLLGIKDSHDRLE
jgi:hypothetical protein